MKMKVTWLIMTKGFTNARTVETQMSSLAESRMAAVEFAGQPFMHEPLLPYSRSKCQLLTCPMNVTLHSALPNDWVRMAKARIEIVATIKSDELI